MTAFALTPAEATVAFDHLLRIGPVGQVIVSTANLYARIKEWIELHAARASQPEDAAEPVRQLYARPAALEGTFESPSTPLEETVAGVWQQVLGIERVGRKDNFFDLGGHSLLAVQVLAKLGRIYGIQVPLRLMFDALTVAELADGVQTLVWSSQGADRRRDPPMSKSRSSRYDDARVPRRSPAAQYSDRGWMAASFGAAAPRRADP